MKKKFFITILSLPIFLSSCSVSKVNISSSGNESKLTKEQWIEDINYFEKYLAAWHINIYHTITKEVDLRNHTGGDDGLMNKFVGKICSNEKLNKKGEIFVIIGRQTMSYGVLACLSLKNYTNAIFIGEPTGGNVNGYGEIRKFTLPNSKIMVTYASKYFKDSAYYKEGFTPDIPVEQSSKDYFNGIDDAYEAIKIEDNMHNIHMINNCSILFSFLKYCSINQ